MSQFLAPIHTWLFNKVLILENIEKNIVIMSEKQYPNSESRIYHQELLSSMGDYIPNVSLEKQIDPSNIHGWLQEKISLAETRQAAFIRFLLSKDPQSKEIIQSLYQQAGVEAAEQIDANLENPMEIYKALNDVVLEGMPCDRVNSIQEQTTEMICWETVHCVHKNNWESQGVDVSMYYGFRAALIQGFVTTVSEHCTYTYNDQNGQLHTIAKEN
jgi:hypothetical protein